MVFFNYSTMQMAAKVVYYGPGLCGKTTNLHYIFSQTSSECRGEMVSLETETDRTLFFDLLPIDVGQIAGFNTRIQLYTVPGQVFYNTTRKLVLKGVDGVVFVADSQRAMLQANVESLKNLEENLAEMSIDLDEVPLVLQYNKRDLDDICTVEEMNQALNRNGWPAFESSALTGHGVFETLKGISKLTLLALRQRLTGDQDQGTSAGTGSAAGTSAAPAPATPAAPEPTPEPEAPRAAPASPEPSPPAAAPKPPEPDRTPAAVQASAKPPPAARAAADQTASQADGKAKAKVKPKVKRTSNRDVLNELEKLRRQALKGSSPSPAAGRRAARRSSNGSGELQRDIQLTLPRAEFERARRFSLTVQVEDDDRQVVEAVRDLQVDLDDVDSIDKILLRLNIALAAK